jgi:hypothetical protein
MSLPKEPLLIGGPDYLLSGRAERAGGHRGIYFNFHSVIPSLSRDQFGRFQRPSTFQL